MNDWRGAGGLCDLIVNMLQRTGAQRGGAVERQGTIQENMH